MLIDKQYYNNYTRTTEKEWLLTNGLGGFSALTCASSCARRYHGILIAALYPPVDRKLIVSQFNETVAINDKEYHLATFSTGEFIADGYKYIEYSHINILPEFTYRVDKAIIKKTITMEYDKNKSIVHYKIINGNNDITLNILPLINFRDHHSSMKSDSMNFKMTYEDNGFIATPNGTEHKIYLKSSQGKFIPESNYFYNMFYEFESRRGLDCYEDHFIPGKFTIDIQQNETVDYTIVCALNEEISHTDGIHYINKEVLRQKSLMKEEQAVDSIENILRINGDKFIVKRQSTGAKTIIAGYPWFTDWGRDTMIALSGLTLSTGRYEDAKEILQTFAMYEKNGLLPNVFPDGDNAPAYNTVDAPLWFVNAVWEYYNKTNDKEFVFNTLYPVVKNIIIGYKNGTDNMIFMDEDYLISAGNPETQLTWMDAKVDSWVVTPRHGKTVEINALWYNALMVMHALTNIQEENTEYSVLAEKVKLSFENVFWNAKGGFLYDTLYNGIKDDKIRPNQIFAVSVSFPVITGKKACSVVDIVFSKLYTGHAIRSLAQEDKDYVGIFTGNRYSRDGAYHQGTAWGWLLGYFIYAVKNAYGKSEKYETILKNTINSIEGHIREAGLCSYSEVFSGDFPHTPGGCPQQAWSVSEAIRILSLGEGK